MVGESLGLTLSAIAVPTWMGIAIVAVLVGLALLFLGFPAYLIGVHLLSLLGRGRSATTQEKDLAGRVFREGPISDADESKRVTKPLARPDGDHEATDLVTRMYDLNDRKVEPASSHSPATQSGPTSATPPLPTPPQTPVCPNCWAELKVAPKRKKKCVTCGNYIYVRSRPTGQAMFVTEQEAIGIDRQRRRYRYNQGKNH